MKLEPMRRKLRLQVRIKMLNRWHRSPARYSKTSVDLEQANKQISNSVWSCLQSGVLRALGTSKYSVQRTGRLYWYWNLILIRFKQRQKTKFQMNLLNCGLPLATSSQVWIRINSIKERSTMTLIVLTGLRQKLSNKSSQTFFAGVADTL